MNGIHRISSCCNSLKIRTNLPWQTAQVVMKCRILVVIFQIILYFSQRRSQNAEKVSHIKGRLLDQAMVLFIWVPFQMGRSLKGKNLLPEGVNSFLYEKFLIVCKISDLP